MRNPGLGGFLARSVAYQAAAQAVGVLTGLAMTVLLSRHLGPEGFGGFSYLFAFVYFWLAANDLGINTILVRDLSQQPERAAEILGGALSLRLVLGTATLALAWIVIVAMPFPSDLTIALLIFSLILPLTGLKLPVVLFQARLRFDYGAWVDLATRVGGLLFVLVAVWVEGRLVAVSVALVAGEFLGWILMHRLASGLVRPVWRVDGRYWMVVLRSSLPLGLASLLSALLNRLDFLMLERMTDLVRVGLYGAAYKVTTLVERLPQLVMNTLYPVMARCAREEPDRLRFVYHRTVWGLGALAVPMALGVTLAAGPGIRLLFGEAYAGAVAPLRLLIWASACLYAALPGGVLLISLGHERVSLWAQAVAVGLNVVLNLAWIPRWGVTGAALATLASFLVILIITTVASEVALAGRLSPGRTPERVVMVPPEPGDF